MTREEVYDKCVEVIERISDDLYVSRQILPTEAIDAIIDCAVEEAVLALKGTETVTYTAH